MARLAAHPVPQPGRPAGLLDDPHRPHHVLPELRRDGRQGARDVDGPAAGAGRAGPVRRARRRPSCGSPCRIAAPGIAAGALLAFALSFDDFIITNFNAGSTVTFPMFVWGSAQRGTPVQINVIGTAMFLVAVLLRAGRDGRRQSPQQAKGIEPDAEVPVGS